MFCKFCGAPLENGALFCTNCGKAVSEPVAAQVSTPCAPALPQENQPLSPWAYFGLSLLFNIPVVGFVFLIVFSCSRANINRRNFARSYWCIYLLLAVILAIMAVCGGSFAYQFTGL